jgi:hypothetical protein
MVLNVFSLNPYSKHIAVLIVGRLIEKNASTLVSGVILNKTVKLFPRDFGVSLA